MVKINVLSMIEALRREVLKLDEVSQKSEKKDLSYGKLAIIQVGNNKASELYIKSKKKELVKWGIEPEVIKFECDEECNYPVFSVISEISNKIRELNMDQNVTGIILQLPLPKCIKWSEQGLINSIKAEKNVDGFKQYYDCKPIFTQCTPQGIIHIINNCRDMTGKIVCLIGRGKTVGEPLIKMISKQNCTLICCNSSTSNEQLKKVLAISDIVITAVGHHGLVTTKDLKDGALVIDAGISYIDGKQTGDYIHDDLVNKNVDYTPYIGGVGKMTVAMLAANTIKAYQIQHPFYINDSNKIDEFWDI